MKKTVVMVAMLMMVVAKAALAADPSPVIDFSSMGKMKAAMEDYKEWVTAETKAEAANRASRMIDIANSYNKSGDKQNAAKFMDKAKQFAAIAGLQIPSDSNPEQNAAGNGSQATPAAQQPTQ